DKQLFGSRCATGGFYGCNHRVVFRRLANRVALRALETCDCCTPSHDRHRRFQRIVDEDPSTGDGLRMWSHGTSLVFASERLDGFPHSSRPLADFADLASMTSPSNTSDQPRRLIVVVPAIGGDFRAWEPLLTRLASEPQLKGVRW